MDITLVALVLLAVLLALLTSGLWVALSLYGVGLLGLLVFTPAPAGKVMATTTWGGSDSWALTALPLFIWMAEILFRTRLSDDIFTGLAPWLQRIPGRLVHVNIIGCGVFSAVSGSNAATCATIAKIALPELMRRGYDERMVVGSLTASGTLGILIPPSIMMIVYGFIAQVSIARLFIAGIVPGALIMAIFMGYVMVWAWLHPDKTPPSDLRTSLAEKLYASRRLIPVMALIALVMGTIYLGVVTPTEAATMGAVGALALSALYGSLTWATFVESLVESARTSCMIAFILAGAAFMAMAMAYTGIPRAARRVDHAQQLPAWGFLAALTVLYVRPRLRPRRHLDGGPHLGGRAADDPDRRGSIPSGSGSTSCCMVQVAELTPPVGFPMFIMQTFTGRGPDLYLARRAAVLLPSSRGMAIIMVVPGLVTYLPDRMLNR